MASNSSCGWKGGVVWIVQRNPLYLLSAAFMAIGARLYLVHPNSTAGDIGAVLITLGVLQLYECLVMGILLLLHRSSRSPEDQRSLLLVAALFWTGPLTATIEMSVSRPRLGLLCSLAVLVFAIAELLAVRRWLGLRLGRSVRVLAMVCFVLLVLAPAIVRAQDAADDIRLYVLWWLLAGIALLAAPAISGAGPATRSGLRPAAVLAGITPDLLLAVIILAVTAAQLWGMNYAFCGHARVFYASPLLILASSAALEYLARVAIRNTSALVLASAPALLAVALAAQGFDSAIPLERLPRWLHDPLTATLALSALAVWTAAWRNRSAGLLHTGNLAFAAVVLRARSVFWASPTSFPGTASGSLGTHEISACALALAAYLMLSAIARRSRREAIVALVVLQAATVEWCWGRPGAALIMGSVACWSWLIAVHLRGHWPSTRAMVWPVCALLALTWCYEFQPGFYWSARLNTIALAGALLAVGVFRRRYCVLGLAVLAAETLFLGAEATARGSVPTAALVVVAGFVLLLSGAAISWHKPRLLALTARPPAKHELTAKCEPVLAEQQHQPQPPA